MDYNGCISIIQGYLENSPLVILGSGSSLKYGLPSMKQLATEISNPAYNIVDPAFDDFCLKLDSQGLEMALDSSNLLPETQDRIREIVWQTVNRSDLLWLEKLKTENIEFAVVDLLKKVIQPAQNTATVVTTNYDRIAEYAADLIGATAITGFEGTLIRKLEIEDRRIHVKRIRARERFISIWKVHGSLDWFLDDKDMSRHSLSRLHIRHLIHLSLFRQEKISIAPLTMNHIVASLVKLMKHFYPRHLICVLDTVSMMSIYNLNFWQKLKKENLLLFLPIK